MGWDFGWSAGVRWVVEGFEGGWWEVRRAAVQAAVVEPVDPFQGGELDVVGRSARARVA